MKCKNCGANPETQNVCVLHRINPKGQIGEWICDNCFEILDTLEPSLVKQIKTYIRFPHDGSKIL